MAAALQNAFSASLTMLNVTDLAHQSEALARLHGLKLKHFPSQTISTEALCSEEGASQAIAEFVRSHAVDFIVVATHGRSGWKRLMVGSVTEDVIRECRCPVLVVPEHEHTRDSQHEGIHLVVATDLMPADVALFRAAKDLLRGSTSKGVRLTLLHIAEDMTAATFGIGFGTSTEEVRTELEQEAEQKLSTVATQYFKEFPAMTTVLRAQRPVAEQLIDYIESHDTDLLILAKRPKARVDRMLVGSVADRLIRHARRKLLVVPV